MSSTMKRNTEFNQQGKNSNAKRRCIVKQTTVATTTPPSTPSTVNRAYFPVSKLCSYKSKLTRNDSFDLSSSDNNDDDDDDKDEDHNEEYNSDVELTNRTLVNSNLYSNLNSINKTLKFAPIDANLSKAVSQYSDEEVEDDINDNDDNDDDITDVESNYTVNSHRSGCSISSKKQRSKSSNDILNVNYGSSYGTLNNKRYSVNIADVVKLVPSTDKKDGSEILKGNQNINVDKKNINNNNNNNNSNINNNNINNNNNNNELSNKKFKHSGNIPSSDFIARSRCFEYLVGAIDEAWARYCDSTSHDEDIKYENYNNSDDNINNTNNNNNNNNKNYIDETNNSFNMMANTPNSNTYSSDDDDGYKSGFSETTTVTEYDSDYNKINNTRGRSFSMINNTLIGNYSNNQKVTEVPENLRLQELKHRFTKSKYFLEDLVDSDLFSDCIAFWTKWDLIKYSIIEFVEEDEEDEEDVIESKIEELEVGRFVL